MTAEERQTWKQKFWHNWVKPLTWRGFREINRRAWKGMRNPWLLLLGMTLIVVCPFSFLYFAYNEKWAGSILFPFLSIVGFFFGIGFIVSWNRREHFWKRMEEMFKPYQQHAALLAIVLFIPYAIISLIPNPPKEICKLVVSAGGDEPMWACHTFDKELEVSLIYESGFIKQPQGQKMPGNNRIDTPVGIGGLPLYGSSSGVEPANQDWLHPEGSHYGLVVAKGYPKEDGMKSWRYFPETEPIRSHVIGPGTPGDLYWYRFLVSPGESLCFTPNRITSGEQQKYAHLASGQWVISLWGKKQK